MGAALAAYCVRGGLRATVFCPADTPDVNVREIALQGADVFRVEGLIDDCGRIVGEGKSRLGWFDLSTLKEPYRIEGKKTMGLELAEQFAQLPDAIFIPPGAAPDRSACGRPLMSWRPGWIGSKRPKMFAVQAEGRAPIVRAFESGEEHAPLGGRTHDRRRHPCPCCRRDFLILAPSGRPVGARSLSPMRTSCDQADFTRPWPALVRGWPPHGLAPCR